MKSGNERRSFLKKITIGSIGAAVAPASLLQAAGTENNDKAGNAPVTKRAFNTPYSGAFLNRLAFPIGGIGAGMFCLEGTGAISHMSIRNKP